MRVLRSGVVAVTVGVLLGLCACGQGGKGAGPTGAPTRSAMEIAGAAARNDRDSGSVTMAIRGSVMGHGVEGTVSADHSGKCVAQLDLGARGGKVELRKSGEQAWIKGGPDLWAGAPHPGLADKYVRGAASAQPFGSFVFFCDVATRHADLETVHLDDLAAHGSSTIEGAKVITLVDSAGLTLQISDTLMPHLIQLKSGSADDAPYLLSFSGYGKPITVAVPPADQTVDMPAELKS